MNIEEAFGKCLEYAAQQRAHDTVRTYANGLKHFAAYLTQNKSVDLTSDVKTISGDYFVEFPAYLSMQFAKRTAKVYVSGMKFFLNWMVLHGLCEPSYGETVRIRKAVEMMDRQRADPLPHIPARGHLEKMLDAVRQINEPAPRKERDLALLLFLASSGCRNHEAARLTVGDIDLTERQVILTGKNEKQRFAFFSHETAQALREYWKARGFANKNDPAFARHDKGAGNRREAVSTATVRNIVAEVVALAGIDKGKFTPHYFRHAFAIKMLSETGNLALVQDLLGHASPAVTRVYATIYPEDLRAAHQMVFKE